MASQYTRASPRRSPRTQKTPAIRTASTLSTQTNFFLVQPRKPRITRNVRLAREAAEKAAKATLGPERIPSILAIPTKKGKERLAGAGGLAKASAVQKAAPRPNTHFVFINRRPKITKAATRELPSVKISGVKEADVHGRGKYGLQGAEATLPSKSATASKDGCSDEMGTENNHLDSIRAVEQDAVELDIDRGREPMSGGLSLAELKRELRSKIAEETRRLDDLEAELRGELEAEVEVSSNADYRQSPVPDTEAGAQIDEYQDEFRPQSDCWQHLENADEGGPLSEDLSEVWGDHENQDDYWKQFEEPEETRSVARAYIQLRSQDSRRLYTKRIPRESEKINQPPY
ncbi:hypothetical protein VTL71DRAFT_7994 [Oculimacula yallundae]|uniref:Uncharacterized protein n=1 Tax=Oculimacula yallundae TaxID=86028 RepID=A0ABR4CWA3_9HELO